MNAQENWTDYDAGLLNDFGGGNVDWWQDYLRAEIGRANDFWRGQLEGQEAIEASLRAKVATVSAREADLKAKLEKARTALRNLRNECSGKPRTDMLLQLIKEADEALT